MNTAIPKTLAEGIDQKIHAAISAIRHHIAMGLERERAIQIVFNGSTLGWLSWKKVLAGIDDVKTVADKSPQPLGYWHVHPGSPSVVRDENDIIVADHCAVDHARKIARLPSLISTLARLLKSPDLNCENLEAETSSAIEQATALLHSINTGQ